MIFQPVHAAIRAFGSLRLKGDAQLRPPSSRPGQCHREGGDHGRAATLLVSGAGRALGPSRNTLRRPLRMRLRRCRCLGTRHIAEIVSKAEIQAGRRQHHVAFVSTEGKCQEADAAPFIRCTACNPLPHPRGDCHSPSAHRSRAGGVATILLRCRSPPASPCSSPACSGKAGPASKQSAGNQLTASGPPNSPVSRIRGMQQP